MGNILLLFLVLFPMLLSAWVFPLRRRDRRYRNWLIQIIPAVELAAALPVSYTHLTLPTKRIV